MIGSNTIKYFSNLKPILKNIRFLSRFLSNMANPIVNIKSGKLQGQIDKLCNGRDYFSFKGIPYGQPPVGKLRFKDPVPVQPWTGVHDASKHGPVCPQFDMITQELKPGNEDCLYVNVYTTSLDPSARKAVMVFIHGGGFMSGSGDSDMYGPEFLVQHDVVLVTFNYRLEAFGFLCLDIPEAPGNAGMKDQVLALRWVQDNIERFGGDKQNVTIFGESAGSASVTYHLVSPMSKGLFQKAIAQSGTCTGDWSQGSDVAEKTYRACKILGKDTTDPHEALEFLQTVPADELVRISFKCTTKEEHLRGLALHFVPVVEKFPNNAFLSENPADILAKGHAHRVPLMIGYNTLEGAIMMPAEVKQIDYRNEKPSSLVPRSLYEKLSADRVEEIGKMIKEFYCGGSDFNLEDSEKLIAVHSDINFSFPTQAFAHHYVKYCSSTFLYRFNFDTELNFIKKLFGMDQLKGASHADELAYLFCNPMNRDIYQNSVELQEIADQLTRIWTDFSKTGNPTHSSPKIKWPAYSQSGREVLLMEEEYGVGRQADGERMQFWTKLYREAGLLHMDSDSKL